MYLCNCIQEVMGEMSLSKVEKQTFTRIRVEVIDQVVEVMKEDRDFRNKFFYNNFNSFKAV